MNKKILYRIINILCLVIMVGSLVWLILYWKHIPDEIPTHFDVYGDADDFGSKKEIIILPIFAWMIYGMISLIECFPGAWNTGVKVTPENSARVYGILKGMIVILKLFVVLTAFKQLFDEFLLKSYVNLSYFHTQNIWYFIEFHHDILWWRLHSLT